jgi:hypothetical protein
LVLSLAGVSPLPDRTITRGANRSAVAPTKVAAGLWAPKKTSKPRAAKEDDDSREEELLKSPRAPTNSGGGAAKPSKRRPIKMDDSAQGGEGEDDGDEGGGDDDEEEAPKVVKKRKRVVEEEEDEAPDPIVGQPVVIPRLINFALSTAAVRRSFSFDQATLQGDAGFRYGFQIAAESFPMVTRPNGWYRTLGLGLVYEREFGTAIHDMANGMFNGYPFIQTRWGFDLRAGIPAGEWVVIVPAFGYGRSNADLRRGMTTTPTMCTVSGAPDPCFGDVSASYLTADVHVRWAVTPTLGLSLVAGYLQGLGVTGGANQIGAEAASTSMKGFHVDAGGTMLINDWFAVQATIPFRRQSYAFSPGMGTAFTYRAASDMYYGLIVGVAIVK